MLNRMTSKGWLWRNYDGGVRPFQYASASGVREGQPIPNMRTLHLASRANSLAVSRLLSSACRASQRERALPTMRAICASSRSVNIPASFHQS
jgi:hypothetical protein